MCDTLQLNWKLGACQAGNSSAHRQVGTATLKLLGMQSSFDYSVPSRVIMSFVYQMLRVLRFLPGKTPYTFHRVSHLLVDLGWVDFDFGLPLSCPVASAKFPSAQAELGRQWNTQNLSQPNQVHNQMGHPVDQMWEMYRAGHPICRKVLLCISMRVARAHLGSR